MDCAQRAERRRVFLAGVRDGVPIGLGYLAVAFSLGIAARNAGLNAFQGFLISLLNNASAGEYAAFTVIAADSGFLEMALITLITNARYLLMSCSLSQKFSPDTPLYHRLLVGYDVTDELFGIAIARPGYLDPFYSYGAFLPAIPGWAIGTALGVTAGSILPARLVSALSVALFGMFLAIIIPPSKKNPVVLGCVAVSFAASWLCTVLPYVKTLSEGTRTILLTILIASAAALLFPVKDAPEQNALLAVFAPRHTRDGVVDLQIALGHKARDRKPRQAGEIDQRIELFHLAVEQIHLPRGLFARLTAEVRHISAVRQRHDHERVASRHQIGAARHQLIDHNDLLAADAHPEGLDLLHRARDEPAERIIKRQAAFVRVAVEIRHIQLKAERIERMVAGGKQVVDLLALPACKINASHNSPP